MAVVHCGIINEDDNIRSGHSMAVRDMPLYKAKALEINSIL